MKKYLNRPVIASISVLFAGVGVILACAGGWWGIKESTNYTPELFADKAYSPFFYQVDYFYYGIDYDNVQNNRYNSDVANDWHKYLDKQCTISEVTDVLFNTTAGTIDTFINKPQSVPPAFANNNLVRSKDKKKTAFFNYLSLAKEAEKFALQSPDGWSYYDEKPKSKRTASAAFCIKVLNAYKSQKDEFIKQRLLFQLVRAYYFNRDYNSCTAIFEGNVSSFPKNTMYYRTLSYAAGAYMKSGNISKANYYYSLVYNGADELKTTAHFSFKPQDEKDWQQTLALCKTNDEKCTLWQMLGVFYKDEIRSMNEIIKIDPKSEKLELLLVRAVNKIETNLFDSDLSTYDIPRAYENKGVAEGKLAELQKLADGAIKSGNMAKPYQWHMALGYLQILNHDTKNAALNLAEAKKSSNNDKLIASQARLLELINSVSSASTLNEKTENQLLPELEWLGTLSKQENAEVRNFLADTWIKKTMAAKYRKQNDLQKAEFYGESREYYTKENQLHAMQEFLLKKDKTPYEKYCEGIYAYNAGILFEYESIMATLNGNIEQAITLMEKAGKRGETELLSNPFNGGIKDCHDCDHAVTQKTKYTKISTLKKMKEMKDRLSTDVYNNALLLGNAFYNINFYGSSRMFYYNPVLDQGTSSLEMLQKEYLASLTSMAQAGKYYKMALDAATTPEQKAKCTYLLAKCERNEWFNQGGGEKGPDFIAFKNFAALSNYASTNYYKDVIKECGWFKKYAHQ